MNRELDSSNSTVDVTETKTKDQRPNQHSCPTQTRYLRKPFGLSVIQRAPVRSSTRSLMLTRSQAWLMFERFPVRAAILNSTKKSCPKHSPRLESITCIFRHLAAGEDPDLSQQTLHGRIHRFGLMPITWRVRNSSRALRNYLRSRPRNELQSCAQRHCGGAVIAA